jgi:hypothetical protein
MEADKLGANKLADLMRDGYIAECYVPNKRIMELREIVRHRAAFVRMRTKLKKGGGRISVSLSSSLWLRC